MIVTFLKDHLHYKKGQIIKRPYEMAAYLVRQGIAKMEEPVNDETIERNLKEKLKSAKNNK